jgi:large subunit ribosomal protein L33
MIAKRAWRRGGGGNRCRPPLTSRRGFVFSAALRTPAGGAYPFGPARTDAMAKPASIKIRLNSSADTGYFYVAKKNARTKTDKLVLKKYDPVVRKHVEFKEGKIK